MICKPAHPPSAVSPAAAPPPPVGGWVPWAACSEMEGREVPHGLEESPLSRLRRQLPRWGSRPFLCRSVVPLPDLPGSRQKQGRKAGFDSAKTQAQSPVSCCGDGALLAKREGKILIWMACITRTNTSFSPQYTPPRWPAGQRLRQSVRRDSCGRRSTCRWSADSGRPCRW